MCNGGVRQTIIQTVVFLSFALGLVRLRGNDSNTCKIAHLTTLPKASTVGVIYLGSTHLNNIEATPSGNVVRASLSNIIHSVLADIFSHLVSNDAVFG
jgi:hypothetical protein